MKRLDRRYWLKGAGLLTGGALAARFVGATAGTVPPDAQKGALIRLSLNENPFGPAASVAHAIQAEVGSLCRYTAAEAGRLLQLIAAKEGIPEEQIILGEILEPLGTYLSLQGGAGGEFIYSDPGYTALIDAALAVGGLGVPVPLNAALQNDLPAIAAR
jgi:histidinol-phosphate aminotransferase